MCIVISVFKYLYFSPTKTSTLWLQFLSQSSSYPNKIWPNIKFINRKEKVYLLLLLHPLRWCGRYTLVQSQTHLSHASFLSKNLSGGKGLRCWLLSSSRPQFLQLCSISIRGVVRVLDQVFLSCLAELLRTSSTLWRLLLFGIE